MKLKISHKKPPHWRIMKAVFNPDWERTAFAFGNTIYSKYELPDHLIVHEKVHLNQQFRNIVCAWIWLALYLLSKRFRYTMEVQAYRKQWQFFKEKYPFNQRGSFIQKVAGDLSGKLYGNIVTYTEAVRAITQ